jgi:hypothetical protein
MGAINSWQRFICLLLVSFSALEREAKAKVTWEAPAEVNITGFHRSTTALLKRATITTDNFGNSSTGVFDLVSSQQFDKLWLGPKTDQFFEINGRITGLYTHGSRLVFLFADIPATDSKAVAEKIASFEHDPRNLVDPKRDADIYDLEKIFGYGFIPSRNHDSRLFTLSLFSASIHDGQLTVFLKSNSNVSLALIFNERLELSSAFRDNEKIPLIRSGKVSPSLYNWSAPVFRKVEGIRGAESVAGSTAIISGEKIPGDYQALALWSESGLVWFGDAKCALVTLGDRITGFKILPNADLSIYPYTARLSRQDSNVGAFETMLKEFQQQLSDGKLPEVQTIHLSRFFPAESFQEDPDLWVRSATVKDDKVQLRIRTHDSKKDFTVVLDHSFQILSVAEGR